MEQVSLDEMLQRKFDKRKMVKLGEHLTALEFEICMQIREYSFHRNSFHACRERQTIKACPPTYIFSMALNYNETELFLALFEEVQNFCFDKKITKPQKVVEYFKK